VALDVSIISLGLLVGALVISMLARAVFLDHPGPRAGSTQHAAARIGGSEAPAGRAGTPARGAAGGGARSGRDQAPASGEAAVPGRIIRVQVQNGCGVSGAGNKLASVLRRAGGFDVIDIGNADAFDFEQTVVVDRTGDGVAARAVARALGDPPIIRQRQAGRSFAVTVIVGYDGGRWKKALAGGTP
jgi:hypothetical protein